MMDSASSCTKKNEFKFAEHGRGMAKTGGEKTD